MEKKHVVIGVSGGIAAYKACDLVSKLSKKDYEIKVVMTKHAQEFVKPINFESLSKHKCEVSLFDETNEDPIAHITLAKWADIMVLVPATANIIAKVVHGIADDIVSTTFLACHTKKLICPAMNVHMYENPIVQDNMKKLASYGYEIIEADEGYLACRDIGKGKLPPEHVLVDYIIRACAMDKDLAGKKVLVTAGATQESIDPVRYITNHSTGKMGYALARMAAFRGAEVTLVAGPTNLEDPLFVDMVKVVTAEDMYEAVTSRSADMDIIIKAAAVADYRPENVSDEKIKKQDGNMAIPLTRTKDILAYLGEHKKDGQFICGFSMETEHMVENSKKKLEKKHIDMVAANNLKVEGAGFGVDTNIMTLITKEGEKELPLMSKEDVANAILDEIIAKIN